MRKIYVIGEISEEAYATFTLELSELEAESEDAIVVELYSQGGDAEVALAFYSRIKDSPCEIIIEAYGMICSAAVLLIAAGDERYMAKTGWLMVHEDAGETVGSVTEIEKFGVRLRALEDQWAILLESCTGTSAAEWAELHANTTYLTADECLKLGIIDEVF